MHLKYLVIYITYCQVKYLDQWITPIVLFTTKFLLLYSKYSII